MPAISVYLKDSLLSEIKAHTAKTGQPVSAFIATACSKVLFSERPKSAVVGKEGVSWTAAMPAEDAARTQLAASNVHTGLKVYYLPLDYDTSAMVPGAPIPPGSAEAQ